MTYDPRQPYDPVADAMRRHPAGKARVGIARTPPFWLSVSELTGRIYAVTSGEMDPDGNVVAVEKWDLTDDLDRLGYGPKS